MGAREEEFARGRGHKLSDISIRSNKFPNKCFECGDHVYRSEGRMVKPEGTDKIQTVCRVCARNWHSKESLNNPLVMKGLRETAQWEDYQKSKEQNGA